jgi:hypothetical protein
MLKETISTCMRLNELQVSICILESLTSASLQNKDPLAHFCCTARTVG